MKKTIIAISVLMSFAVMAESGKQNDNPGNSGGGNSTSSSSNSNSLAGAAAISGSNSNASGTGIAGSYSDSGSVSGSTSSGGAAHSNSNSAGGHSYSALNNDSRSIAFAAPAFTIVPTSSGNIVTNSRAFSIPFLFSMSKTDQKSDVVQTLISMANAAKRVCRFKHADFLEEQAFKIMVPGVAWPRLDNVADLDHVSCTILHTTMPR